MVCIEVTLLCNAKYTRIAHISLIIGFGIEFQTRQRCSDELMRSLKNAGLWYEYDDERVARGEDALIKFFARVIALKTLIHILLLLTALLN